VVSSKVVAPAVLHPLLVPLVGGVLEALSRLKALGGGQAGTGTDVDVAPFLVWCGDECWVDSSTHEAPWAFYWAMRRTIPCLPTARYDQTAGLALGLHLETADTT
jgi:hypothetical protein